MIHRSWLKSLLVITPLDGIFLLEKLMSLQGPIFPVLKWETEDEVIKRANNTLMGLGASVWTTDLKRAGRIAKRIKAGNVWVNTHLEVQPDAAFGGFKQSGLGAEWGEQGLKSYCNAQTLYLKK